MSDNTKLIEAIKDAENAITKALNTLKAIASDIDPLRMTNCKTQAAQTQAASEHNGSAKR